MIIDIVENCDLFFSLVSLNKVIEDFASKFKYNEPGRDYDFTNRVISSWFNPRKIRDLGISRTYPRMDPVQYRPEYCLIIHCSNYLPLFLMDKLYRDRKDVLFEDIGAGLGWLYVYLKAIGFYNFHTVEDFSQLSEEACVEFREYADLDVNINLPYLRPVVSNNVGVPAFPFRDASIDESTNLELIICYTHREFDKYFADNMNRLGFSFLCRDSDDLSTAYCRNDKYEEFSSILKVYQ
jgi:hypothetical protein